MSQYNITSNSTEIVVIECFNQCMILLVKLFHLIYAMLFKMQKTQVTFSLTLILKVRILDILKLL